MVAIVYSASGSAICIQPNNKSQLLSLVHKVMRHADSMLSWEYVTLVPHLLSSCRHIFVDLSIC